MNEILRPVVSEWELDIPRLPSILDGLSIVQLSDLHFSGRIGKTYFREIVRICNEQESELVCITGDIVDKTACFDWLPETLGRLSARHGVYFILGNHDLQVDSNRVRQILEQSGLIDLGSRCHRIEISGTPILLTGNERPWFHGAVGFTEENDALPSDNSVLRIVLAHCPDQFTWARRQHADLMLAGHTHGGQIRIPPLGAIFSPTLHGVKFISGVYDLPPTILHVSRGTSGDTPVRWNCPPEICHLRLRSTQKSPGRSQ
jgi:predicted MPP superfamily phosphohydrolase